MSNVSPRERVTAAIKSVMAEAERSCIDPRHAAMRAFPHLPHSIIDWDDLRLLDVEAV